MSQIQSIIKESRIRGLALVMYHNENLIGFLKAFTSEFRRKAHVLTNSTMMIDPTVIGQGFGTRLLRTYLDEIQTTMQHIRVMELLPYNLNVKGIQLYERMGFVHVATSPNKIRYVDGTFGDQLLMHWINPNFCDKALEKYHDYLQRLIKVVDE